LPDSQAQPSIAEPAVAAKIRGKFNIPCFLLLALRPIRFFWRLYREVGGLAARRAVQIVAQARYRLIYDTPHPVDPAERAVRVDAMPGGERRFSQ
jgi:hypothetical protein